MQRAMPASSAPQLGQVGGGVALEQPPVGGVGARRDGARSRAPRPRRCAGRATSAGRTRTPPRRSLSPGSRAGTAGAEVDDRGVAAAVVDDLVDPGVELVAAGEDELGAGRGLDVAGARLVLVGVGVRLQDLIDVDRAAADLAHPVADLSGGGDDLELAVVDRARAAAAGAEQAQAERRRGDGQRRGATAVAIARTTATTAKTAPATQAIVAPGGASVLTESHSPTVPSAATRATLASCQLQHPAGEQARGRGRHDEQGS